MINTPQAFIDYIESCTFDYSSLHAWERETLSQYLGLTGERTMKDVPTVIDFDKPYFALIGVHYQDQQSYTLPDFGNVQLLPLSATTFGEAHKEVLQYIKETEYRLKNVIIIDTEAVTHILTFGDTKKEELSEWEEYKRLKAKFSLYNLD